jgi:hypothetical protein
VTVNTHIIFFGLIFTKRKHGARPCVEKMQFIFFVPPNEELEGTLHPQKIGCTPKNEGKRVHVPLDEKTCGHTDYFVAWDRSHDVFHKIKLPYICSMYDTGFKVLSMKINYLAPFKHKHKHEKFAHEN